MPADRLLTQGAATRIMDEHHVEAARRGLPEQMPKVRAEREGDEMVYSLDYRAPRR